MYGHMDKQPFGEGWDTDPCDPVIKDGIMYGRGSNDDGYSLFCAILSIKACQTLGRGHPRIVITIEGSEEGEIHDLIFYMQKHKEELGNPDLVVCLDSIANNTETLFVTSTLRGCINFDVKVQTGKNNMHSGHSGAFPQPFYVINQLLGRVIDLNTQELLPDFQPKIPDYCIEQTHQVSRIWPDCKSPNILDEVTGLTNQHAGKDDAKEKLEQNLNMWWRPTLTVIGIEGLPSDLNSAGNVVYKEITYRLSMRTAPNQDCDELIEKLRKAFTEAPASISYNAKVDFNVVDSGPGFCAPDLPEKVKNVVT